ncbi:hypothetical protein BH11GEM1_BH11GEM1_20920 [soil metagenome]
MRGAGGALDIEEKLNIVLENFEEFEGALLSLALDRALFQQGEWSSQIADLHSLNRRLVNLLATARLYIDQVPHSLSLLFETNREIPDAFDRMKSREYDGFVGYRAMEAVRNYMQHRSLPIHVISHNSRRLDRGTTPLLEQTVNAVIHPHDYRGDGKFKAEVLKELETIGPNVDLPPLVRQFVSCLGRIHTDLRGLLAPFEASWDSVIKECGDQFLAAGASDLTGLVLVSLTGDRTYDVIVHIAPGPVIRRQELERKNRYVQHYERILVANRPTG